jgi:ACR3 family arsenite efflux pump ArsB
LIGLLLYIIFPLFAGFGGRVFVSRNDLKAWDGLVKSLRILYFSAILFTTIGIFIFLGNVTRILDMLA